jgi:S-adenosylmethionine hydrolase
VKVQDGLATFANLSLDKAGEYALKATDHCLSSATSTSFAVTPAAAVRMVFFDIPSCDSNGKTFKVQVALFDRYGNLATNDTSSVTLSLGAHPKNDVLTGTLTAVVVNGIATFDDLSLSGEGWYSLVAMDSDGIPSISSSLIYFGRDVCGFV